MILAQSYFLSVYSYLIWSDIISKYDYEKGCPVVKPTELNNIIVLYYNIIEFSGQT